MSTTAEAKIKKGKVPIPAGEILADGTRIVFSEESETTIYAVYIHHKTGHTCLGIYDKRTNEAVSVWIENLKYILAKVQEVAK